MVSDLSWVISATASRTGTNSKQARSVTALDMVSSRREWRAERKEPHAEEESRKDSRARELSWNSLGEVRCRNLAKKKGRSGDNHS